MRPYGWFGLVLLAASEYGRARGIEPFVTWFFCFAWWSYVLLADNLLLRLRGESLLADGRREFWGMAWISVFAWLLFEAYNLRIHNWSYTVPAMPTLERWAGYTLSFSTVLPGVFVTSALVEALFRRGSRTMVWQPEPPAPGRRTVPSPGYLALGLAMSAAPLVWPRTCFAAVWVGPILLLDPLLEKAGVAGLSLAISSGRRARVWSLLAGGALCGLLWETWNFRAGAKWQYTVPYFGRWKVFEMPALGFLGFPPFALECWILYHLIRAAYCRAPSRAARIALCIVLGILSIIIFGGIDSRTCRI